MMSDKAMQRASEWLVVIQLCWSISVEMRWEFSWKIAQVAAVLRALRETPMMVSHE